MRIIRSVLFLSVVVLVGLGSLPLKAADDDGVALGILYDTSGSMKDRVPDKSGSQSPKYVIANRALITIARQIQTYVTNGPAGTSRRVDAGLFTFQKETAKEVVKFGPFDADAFRGFAKEFSHPKGDTPLGNALRKVSQAVLDSPLPRKHIVVITDGMNTDGPDPAQVLPGIKRKAAREGQVVFVHFIAFDVDAATFDPLKKLGATVVGAADESQLDSQLDFILQNQILLEKPSKTK